MAKVRMLVRISGSRDGEDWPAIGEVIDLPEAEAARLIRNLQAVDPDAGKAEHATAKTDAVETAVKPAGRRPVNATKDKK